MKTVTGPPPGPSPAPSRIEIVTTLFLVALYCVAVHLLIVDHTKPPLTLLVISAPWLVAAGFAAAPVLRRRCPGRALPALIVAFGIACGGACILALGHWLDGRVDLPIFAESFVFLASLALLFATSLRGGREALVTRLARIARRDDMPPAVVRYTRRVTVGWAMFFAFAAASSAVLFATQSREVWSAFINLALWPTTAAAFAIEYAIRLRVLPDVAHSSPMVGVRAFMHRDDVVVAPAQERCG